jgi:hypothetical protein
VLLPLKLLVLIIELNRVFRFVSIVRNIKYSDSLLISYVKLQVISSVGFVRGAGLSFKIG